MYSSGNMDVRNWVHLFESPCICNSFTCKYPMLFRDWILCVNIDNANCGNC